MLPGPPPSWPAPDPGGRATTPLAPPAPAAAADRPPPRRGRWGWVAVAVVVAAGLGLGAWFLLRDDSTSTTAPSTTSRAAPTTTATRPSTASASTAPVATTAAPAPSTSTPATVAPTTAATTAVPAGGPAPPSASLVPGVGTTPDDEPALSAAQAVAAALADGDWAAVRRLSPDEGRTDTQLQVAYGALTDVAIVPAHVERSGGQVELRLGLVAHEDDPGGPATALLCAHWRFDPATRTVDRVSSVRLRLEPGRVDPATVAPELTRTCASYPLR